MITVSELHPSNIDASIAVMLFERVAPVSAVHFLNAEPSTVVTLFGITMLASLVQELNAKEPIEVRPLPRVIDERFAQPLNA